MRWLHDALIGQLDPDDATTFVWCHGRYMHAGECRCMCECAASTVLGCLAPGRHWLSAQMEAQDFTKGEG